MSREDEYWTAFEAFRLAHWVRSHVQNLCHPKGQSEYFPAVAKTRVDKRFIEFCRAQFRQMLGIEAGEVLPVQAAEALTTVLCPVESCRRRNVASLDQPMRNVQQHYILVLTRLVSDNASVILPITGETRANLEIQVNRIAGQPTKDAWATAARLHNVLMQVGVVPSKEGAILQGLTMRERVLMAVLLKLDAVDRTRKTTLAAALKASTQSKSDPNTYKTVVVSLHKKTLINTVASRSGGCYLTPKGVRIASRLESNQKGTV